MNNTDRISPKLASLHWLPIKSRTHFKILTYKALQGTGGGEPWAIRPVCCGTSNLSRYWRLTPPLKMDLKTFLFRKEIFSYAATGRGCRGTEAVSSPVLRARRSGSRFLYVLEAHVTDSVQIKLNYSTSDRCRPWGNGWRYGTVFNVIVKSVFCCKKGHFYKKANFMRTAVTGSFIFMTRFLSLFPTVHESPILPLGILCLRVSFNGSPGHFQGPSELMEPDRQREPKSKKKGDRTYGNKMGWKQTLLALFLHAMNFVPTDENECFVVLFAGCHSKCV